MHSHALASDRHPRLAAYLAGLDEGIDSWPEYRAKASLLCAGLRVRPLDPDALDGVPARLRALVEQPPLESLWISEVDYQAFALLTADVYGLYDAAFGRLWYEVMSDLVRGRLYSVMLRWISASTLLRTTAARWGTFHRGIVLETTRTESGLYLDMRFPEGMVPHLCVVGYTQVWQSLVDHSSTRDVVASLVASDGSSARYYCDGYR